MVCRRRIDDDGLLPAICTHEYRFNGERESERERGWP